MKLIQRTRRTAHVLDSKRDQKPIWLFDLDNTLNHTAPKIWPRVHQDMTNYLMRSLNVDEARATQVRAQYWRQYGATLTGMVRNHGTDPHDFLRETHRFPDMAQLVDKQIQLAHNLRRLPGIKIVLTNAPVAYANQLLRCIELHRVFDAVICIEHMQFTGRWQPKPDDSMLRRLLARLKIQASRAILIEDTVENLHSANRCGIGSVWVRSMAMQRNKNPFVAGRARKVSVQVQSVRNLMRLART